MATGSLNSLASGQMFVATTGKYEKRRSRNVTELSFYFLKNEEFYI
jgi:hypothetical protein